MIGKATPNSVRAVLALILAASITLSSCGGDDDDGPGDPTVVPTEPPTTLEPPDPTRTTLPEPSP